MNIEEQYKTKIKDLIKDTTKINSIKAKVEQEGENIMLLFMQDEKLSAKEKVDLYNYVEEWKKQAIEEHLQYLENEKAKQQDEKAKEKQRLKTQKMIKELNDELKIQKEEQKEIKTKAFMLLCILLNGIILIISIIYGISLLK